jgi:endonuclease G, mitochondrial
MQKQLWYVAILIVMVSTFSCRKSIDTEYSQTSSHITEDVAARSIYNTFPETFEIGTKTAYAAANVTLATGSWNMADALIGTSSSDRKNGAKSVRMQLAGTLTMNFDVANGASVVTILHGVYGTDASSTWQLWYSINGGTSWVQTGGTITTSSNSINQATFSPGISGTVRFQLRKIGGGRLNVDDFSITDNITEAATREDNLAMGNPSNAVTDVGFPNNYLLVKTQFALSYNNSRGTANWVSWHLSTSWKGLAARCDCFTQDASLPTGFFKASTSNYTNTGFDRGHMCPSDDRDGSDTDNAATFKMTNIMPQSPVLNQQTWANLETYCRTLINQGNELYIISGGYGQGGTGSLGGVTNTIAGGSITVPSRYWKVIVVLPNGSNDINRVNTATRVIAVDLPNVQTVNSQAWGWYRTSVDAIEASTGYNFLSNVPIYIQSVIEASIDNGPTS